MDGLLANATKGRVSASERRSIALQDIEREKDAVVRDLVILRRETVESAEIMQSAVQEVLKDEFTELRAHVERLVSDFSRNSAENPDGLDQARHEVEKKNSLN